MIARNRASPCMNAQKAWLILARPPARLPIKLDRPSSEDPVGVAQFARIATPKPFFALAHNRHAHQLFRLVRRSPRRVGTARQQEPVGRWGVAVRAPLRLRGTPRQSRDSTFEIVSGMRMTGRGGTT
jgi:hypothetical protein